MALPLEVDEAASSAVGWRLFWLALPVLAEQLLLLGIGQFDTFLAGRIDKTALTAVGLAAYVSWGASLLVALVGTGTTALVARCWGGRDFGQGNRLFNQALPLALLIGCGGGLLIWFAAPGLAAMQNLTGDARNIAVGYLRTDALGHPFNGLMLVIAAALRGSGDMRTPLLLMLLVNAVNVVVSPCLVFGWFGIASWGTAGIVGGTVLARVVGGLVALILMAVGCSGLRWKLADCFPHSADISRILRIGIPSLIEGSAKWLGHFLFLGVVSHLATGDEAVAVFAAHYIGINVEALSYLPAFAWGTASATLIGQSLGAHQYQQARRIGHLAVLQCGGIIVAASLFFYFGADAVFTVMSNDPDVRRLGVPALQFLSWFQIPLAMAIIYTLSLTGAGDTRSPMMFTLLCTIGIRVPVAWFLGIYLHGGLIGAWMGMCADNTIRAALVATRYAQGRWVHLQV